MGAKREYVAIFSIGARLLGSFRGAFAAAQARMNRLRTAAMGLGRSFMKFGAMFTGLVGGLATFGAAKLFGSVFRDATAEIEEQHDRERKLQTMLLANNEIRKKGIGFAKAQVDLVMANNAELAKTGLATADMFDVMAANLAQAGIMPKEIMKIQPVLADALVAMKGINLSEEDAGQAAFMLGKAIRLGVAKPLAKLLPMMTKEQAKAFPKMTMKGRYDMLLAIMKLSKGVNAEALKTPGAQVKKMNEDFSEMAERIGGQLLPMQDRIAVVWRRILPRIEPILTKLVSGVVKAFEALTNYIEDTVLPAFDRLSAFWSTHPELQQGIINIAKNIGLASAAVVAFGLVASVNPMTWVVLAAAAVLLLANNWDTAARSASEYVRQQEAMGKGDTGLTKMVKLLDDFMTGLDLIGVAIDYYITEPLNKAAERLNKISAGWRKIPGLGWTAPAPIEIQKPVAIPGARERLEAKRKPVILPPKPPGEEMLANTIDTYRTAAKNVVMPMQGLRKSTETLGDTTQTTAPMMKDFVTQVNGIADTTPKATTELGYLLAALRTISQITAPSIISTTAGGGVYPAARSVAPTVNAAGGVDIPPANMAPEPLPELQAGGIVRRPTLAMIGERGPEAVVPLGRRGAGQTTVTFAPVVTINGNASAAEQAALDRTLRDLSRDFVAEFKRAQANERRLSYEGGYT